MQLAFNCVLQSIAEYFSFYSRIGYKAMVVRRTRKHLLRLPGPVAYNSFEEDEKIAFIP
jgi:hypothetical protein